MIKSQRRKKQPQKKRLPKQQSQQQKRMPRQRGFVDRALNFGMKYALPVAKTIFGMGDYQIHNETQKNSLFSDGNYNFQRKRTIITHREYVADVVTSSVAGAFSYVTYQINPGQQNLFPWLSTIAQNFEAYKLMGMVFEYKSMSADALNSVNTALGQVIMSVQYDAANLAFTNKQAQEAYDGAISIKPSQSVLLGVECAPSQSVLQQLYIRNNTLPPNTAVQFCDVGVLQVSTNGFQGTSVNVGELWVAYQVEFIHEKLDVDSGDLYARFSMALPTSGLANFGSANTNSAYPGTTPSNSSINFGTLPPGQYQVIVSVQGPITNTASTYSGAGINFNNIYNNNTASSQTIGNAANGIMSVISVQTLIQGAILQFGGLTWTGTATRCDVIVLSAGNPQ